MGTVLSKYKFKYKRKYKYKYIQVQAGAEYVEGVIWEHLEPVFFFTENPTKNGWKYLIFQ